MLADGWLTGFSLAVEKKERKAKKENRFSPG
jgi:hypothetical protein